MPQTTQSNRLEAVARFKQNNFIAIRTEQLLAMAKRSGYFNDVIADATIFFNDGYVWDVALAMSCKYWCN